MTETDISHNQLPSRDMLTPELLHGKEVRISPGSEIYAPEEIGLRSVNDDGSTLKVMSEISFDRMDGTSSNAAIVEHTDIGGNANYVLLGLTAGDNDKTAFYNGNNITLGKTPIKVGRVGDTKTDSGVVGGMKLWGLGFDEFTSSKHIDLSVDEKTGEIVLSDNSTNGTEVYLPKPTDDSENGAAEKVDAKIYGIESKLNDRQREIFAPVKEPKVNDYRGVTNYDYLLDPNTPDDYFSVQKSATRRHNGRVVTENGTAYTQEVYKLPSLDVNVRNMIRQYVDSQDSADLSSVVRSNPELRLRLAEYFINKTWQLAPLMPEKVNNNMQKKPSGITGYEHLPLIFSREWAALLAISKLDGTFQPDKVTLQTDYNENGVATLNQHTYASDILLFN